MCRTNQSGANFRTWLGLSKVGVKCFIIMQIKLLLWKLIISLNVLRKYQYYFIKNRYIRYFYKVHWHYLSIFTHSICLADFSVSEMDESSMFSILRRIFQQIAKSLRQKQLQLYSDPQICTFMGDPFAEIWGTIDALNHHAIIFKFSWKT